MTPNPRNDDTPIPMTRPQQDDRQDMPMSTTRPNTPTSKAQATADAAYEAMIAPIIEAQIGFIQQWLSSQQHQQRLTLTFWQWLGTQPLTRYLSADDISHVINHWLLKQQMSETLRRDIRAIVHSITFHPSNDDSPLSEILDESQISALAHYVGSHESQRGILIHSLIGNDAFADMLTQTIYHAIDDFMSSTLDKAGGVGKLMKMGRSSFERATNNNLDSKLQAYLHRNIKELSLKAESSAQAHLSNEEVARLIEMGWSRIKNLPISTLQRYLYDDDNTSNTEVYSVKTDHLNSSHLESDYLKNSHSADCPSSSKVMPDNSSRDTGYKSDNNFKETPINATLHRLEAGFQTSYERLRVSPHTQALVSAGVETWFSHHASDRIADIASSLHLNDAAIMALLPSLNPLLNDIAQSAWLADELRPLLQAFYAQADIQSQLTGYQSQ